MRRPESDLTDELGAHPDDYTAMPDGAAGVMICLRCLTHAVIRVAAALESANEDRRAETYEE